jgi:hypothetical protein
LDLFGPMIFSGMRGLNLTQIGVTFRVEVLNDASGIADTLAQTSREGVTQQ